MIPQRKKKYEWQQSQEKKKELKTFSYSSKTSCSEPTFTDKLDMEKGWSEAQCSLSSLVIYKIFKIRQDF